MILGILYLQTLVKILWLVNGFTGQNITSMVLWNITKLDWLLQVITNRQVLIFMRLSPDVHPTPIRLVLSLTVTYKWPIR